MKYFISFLLSIAWAPLFANNFPLDDFLTLPWSQRDGQSTTLQPLVDKPTTVINYWATWCGPCLQELPSLVELSKNNDIRVILINVDNDGPISATQTIKKFNAPNVIWLYDPKEIHRTTLGILSLPITFILKNQAVTVINGNQNWSLDYLQRVTKN